MKFICEMVKETGLKQEKKNRNVLFARSNPVLTSGLDLFLVILDSILPHLVNNQLVGSSQLWFLIMFLLSLNCFFQMIKSGVPVN